MDFEAFKELVEKTKNDHPVWFGLEPDESPDDAAVTEAEERLGARLPTDYKNFIFEYGGGYFAFSNVFSLEERSDWNLVDQNYKYDAIRKGHVLISENGSGDFYGFKVVDGVCDPKICFYDHEVEAWQESPHSSLFDYLEKFALSN
ncbi:SMI1/KNR4 family protein [Atopomonas hussainii]|uniref:SMI1/KNR4 family protein n=1 Tax=Atopomonas hussainii TaxID=1429083 RepID=UPI0008FFEB24|nr:SMI1/KNR4 family protein [Atopomonas hussainii]